MNLTAPTNAVLGQATGAGNIVDDDTARLAMQGDPAVVEGNSGFNPVVFTATLSTPAAFTVTLDYAVTSGFGVTGATADVDFVGTLASTLNLLPGQTAATFSVNVVGDTQPEHDEEFRADISYANAPILFTTAFATILNDDGEVPDDEYSSFLPMVTG